MRYISLFLFVVVIGISSVAEGQEDGGRSDHSGSTVDDSQTL